jgi:RHS repeat-associated protein
MGYEKSLESAVHSRNIVFGMGPDQPISSISSSSSVTWYVTDNQGSVREVINNSGTVSASTTYSAFGQITTGSLYDRYGYAGEQYDNLTGLYSYGNGKRQYNPATGDWNQPDPLYPMSGVNPYEYVGDSPEDWSDPSGMATGSGSPGADLGPDDTDPDESEDDDELPGEMNTLNPDVTGQMLMMPDDRGSPVGGFQLVPIEDFEDSLSEARQNQLAQQNGWTFLGGGGSQVGSPQIVPIENVEGSSQDRMSQLAQQNGWVFFGGGGSQIVPIPIENVEGSSQDRMTQLAQQNGWVFFGGNPFGSRIQPASGIGGIYVPYNEAAIWQKLWGDNLRYEDLGNGFVRINVTDSARNSATYEAISNWLNAVGIYNTNAQDRALESVLNGLYQGGILAADPNYPVNNPKANPAVILNPNGKGQNPDPANSQVRPGFQLVQNFDLDGQGRVIANKVLNSPDRYINIMVNVEYLASVSRMPLAGIPGVPESLTRPFPQSALNQMFNRAGRQFVDGLAAIGQIAGEGLHYIGLAISCGGEIALGGFLFEFCPPLGLFFIYHGGERATMLAASPKGNLLMGLTPYLIDKVSDAAGCGLSREQVLAINDGIGDYPQLVFGIYQAGRGVFYILDAATGRLVALKIGPLASVLEGHGPGQGFTGVYDSATGKVLIKPSTEAAEIPSGWVARSGGHADVSKALGGDAANHLGFAVILQEDGTLAVTWRSGVLNPGPDSLVPQSARNVIVEAIENATGRKVSSY